jgi:uncharacterized membrane protein
MTEDLHPPSFFALNHLWMNLWSTPGENVSIAVTRSLAAVFGILSIPAIYFGTYLISNSIVNAQIAAALMAVSPYGIYIAQEARHYSNAIFWLIGSLTCFTLTTQHIYANKKIPFLLVISWILINNVGIFTHYFFLFTLIGQGIAGVVCLWLYLKDNKTTDVSNLQALKLIPQSSWLKLGIVFLGTLLGGIIGVLTFRQTHDPTLIQWLKTSFQDPLQYINPIAQTIAAIVPMFVLFPIELINYPTTIWHYIIFGISILGMLTFIVWLYPLIYRNIQAIWSEVTVKVLTFYGLSIILLYWTMALLGGMDITKGARYHFTYFPSIIMITSFALFYSWQKSPNNLNNLFKLNGRKTVTLTIVIGIISSLFIATDLSFPKYYRPELLVPMINQSAPNLTLITTTRHNITNVGEILGIATEMGRSSPKSQISNTKFLFVKPDQTPTTLQEEIQNLPKPFDLWLINYSSSPSIPNTCSKDQKFTLAVYGYDYKLYHCNN